jgi:hypothetical protein
MKIKFLSILAVGVLLTSCSSDDNSDASKKMVLNLPGLDNLGPNFKYEGWIVINGVKVTTGTFTVNDAGTMSKTEFDVNSEQLANATDFVLTIEPANDTDPAPTNTKYLKGSFSGATASVSTGVIGNFSDSAGKYLLGTPTNGNLNPSAGVWFMDGNGPSVGLNLPTLGPGWKYEGWVVVGDVKLSTGIFSNPNGPDNAAIYSGSMSAPPFPGEDFLTNAPAGFVFPGNLSGTKVVISVEPFPDNSPSPFKLKPLSHTIASPAVTGTTINMMRDLSSFPSGTVTR